MSAFGAFASAVGSSIAGAIGQTTGNILTQAQQFEYNKQLQANSFQHDKEMLEAQVKTSIKLAEQQLGLRYNILRAGGYTAVDAARGALGAPTTRVLDWNGTRNYAPSAAVTSTFAGTFAPIPSARPKKQQASTQTETPQVSRAPSLASSDSWGQPQASLSTVSTSLSSLPSRRSSRRPSLPGSWYTGSSRSLSPFGPGALQLTYLSSASSSSTPSPASTVDERLLNSWKPFNLRNQPGFTRFHPRGSSNA